MAVTWFDLVGGVHDGVLVASNYDPDALNTSQTGGSLIIKTSGGTFGTTKHLLETGTSASGQALVWYDFAGATSVAFAKEMVIKTNHTAEAYVFSFSSAAGTRQFTIAFTGAAGVIRVRDGAGAAKWTVSPSATSAPVAISLDLKVLITMFVTQSSTVGTYRVVVYNLDTAAIILDSGLQTGQNTGANPYGRITQGVKGSTGTGTAVFESASWALDTAATDVIAPRSTDTVSAGADKTNIEPWTTVDLIATASDGSATWSQISGSPTVTLTGSGALQRSFIAPPLLAGCTLGFRATNGAATDDMTVTVLPATDAFMNPTGPTLQPVRLIRVP